MLIHWPALVRVESDAELLVVESATQLTDPTWREDTGYFSHSGSVTQQGQPMLLAELVDSDGRVFTLRETEAGSMEYHATDRYYELDEVIQFVQLHAAVQGYCCVAKFGAKSIQQTITLVEHLGHD